MKNRKVTMLIAAATVLGLVGCSPKIEQTQFSTDLELGEALEINLNDYFNCKDQSEIDKLNIDISAVDSNKLGTYEAVVSNGKEEFSIEVNVKDTKSPTIALKAELPAVILGDTIKPSDFIDYEDNGECKVYFVLENETQSEELEITEDLVDLKDVYVVVVDEAGNSTGITVEGLSISKVKIAEKLDTQLYVVKPGTIYELDNEESGLLAVAELGAYLTVTGKTSNGWYEVKWGNDKGYLPADALSKDNPTPAEDPNQVYGDNGMTAQEITDKFNELMGNFDADSALGGGLPEDIEVTPCPDYGDGSIKWDDLD